MRDVAVAGTFSGTAAAQMGFGSRIDQQQLQEQRRAANAAEANVEVGRQVLGAVERGNRGMGNLVIQ
jgi:hypothetical protein